MFDFDCNGPGYRIYDLAVFLWNLKTHYKEKEIENWVPFIQGYRTVRVLTDRELTSILWFVESPQDLARGHLSRE